MVKRFIHIGFLLSAFVTNIFAQVTITSTDVINVSCNSFGNGSITIGISDAGNNPPYTYELRRNSDLALISSNTTSNLSHTFNALLPNVYFIRVIDNIGQSDLKPNVLVTEPSVLTEGEIGTNHSICSGGDPNNLTSEEDASGGTGVIQYDWEYSDNGGGSWTSLGINNREYNPPAPLNVTRMYRRKAWNTCSPVYTTPVTVTVNTPPTSGGDIGISGVDAPSIICYNTDPASFASANVASGGSPAPQYVWQYTTNMAAVPGDGNWTDIATSNSLTFDYNVPLTVTTKFVRKFYNTCGAVYSDVIQVNVNPEITATVNSTNVTCNGLGNGTITISGASGGSNLFQYTINGGTSWLNTSNFTNLGPATYNVQIRDRNYTSCVRILNSSLTITQPAILSGGSISILHGPTCSDSNDGQLRANPTGGTAPYSYQWQIRAGAVFNNIPGETNRDFLSAMPGNTYRCVINDANSCGQVFSSINFTKAALPIGVRDSIPDAIVFGVASVTNACQGQANGSVTINVTAGGVTPYTYSITTGGGSGYQLSNTFNTLAGGTYQQWVEDRRTCRKRGVDVVVAVNPLPTAYNVTGGGSLCAGGAGVPVGLDDSDAGIHYQLYRGALAIGGPVAGTGVAISFGNQTVAGTYTVVATNAATLCTNPMTGNAVVTVNPLPTAYNVTGGGGYCTGGAGVPVGLDDSDAGINYQLYRGALAIGGPVAGTGVAISFGNQTVAGTYTVVATNAATLCTNPMTGNVDVTINPQPTITLGANPSVCRGINITSLTYSALIGGADRYSIDFDATAEAQGFVDVVDAILPVSPISITVPILANPTVYNASLTIRNNGTGCESNLYNITITVLDLPAITLEPHDAEICEGSDTSFTVGATGADLIYQWQLNTGSGWNNVANDAIYSGTQTSTLNITGTLLSMDGYSYRCVVSGSCAPAVTSVPATLTVNEAPHITVQPFDATSCEGDNAIFTLTATGQDLSYQWQVNDGGGWVNLADVGVYSGSSTSTLTITDALQSMDNYQFSCIVSGKCSPAVTSNTATLTVNQSTEIITQPLSTLLCIGADAQFTVQAAGTGVITYSWQTDKSGIWANLINGGKVSGANSSTLIITGIDESDEAHYRCIVHSDCGSDIISDPALLDANVITATIGKPTPFLISNTTVINVGIKVRNHVHIDDLSYNLVAPDGTKVALKRSFWLDAGYGYANNDVNLEFTTLKPITDTIPTTATLDATPGTYAATGDWSAIYGKDPANGAWKVEIEDIYSDGTNSGELTEASISFTDINYNSKLETINYFSGAVSVEIVDPVDDGCLSSGCGTITAKTDYIIPMGLRTKCSNSCDAKAVVTVAGGIGPFTYEWYDQADPAVVIATGKETDLCKGSYFVVVTDAIGCTATATVEVTSPDPIKIDNVTYSANVVSNKLKCNGEKADITINATGGTGALRYTYDGASTTNNIGTPFTNLSAGTYQFHILDLNDCIKDTTITITEPDALVIDEVTYKQILCAGGNSGEIQVTVIGGTTPYTFELSDGTTNATGIFTGLVAGTYTVTITDINGCGGIVTAPVDLVDPQVLEISSVESVNVKCFGENNGSIVIHGKGGTKPYTFSVDGGVTFQNDSTFNALIPDVYNPVIKDANGCLTPAAAPVTITEPTDIVITSVAKVDVTSCYTSPEGSIDITASGGTGALLYSINGGTDFSTSSSFTGLLGGTYNVVVQDASLCTETRTVIIDRPAEIVVTALTFTNVSGISKGTIHVEATGGTGSITYSLNDGPYQASGDFVNLDPGTYNIKIKDSNNCLIERTVIISDLVVDIQKKDVNCYGETTGEIILTVLSGGNNILYSIDGGVTSQDNGNFTNLASGIYNIKVWDETGATFETAVSIGSGSQITASVLISDITTCAGSNSGAVLILANGGSGNLKYSIDDGTTYQDEDLFNNLIAGSYDIRVADESGCYIPKTAVIKEPVAISIDVQTTQVRGLTKGSAHVDATGGTGTLQYSLDGVTYQASPDFSELDAKTYTIYVKDANDCVKTSTFEITQSPFTVNAIVNNACNDDNGAIAVSCADCVTGTQYSIDDGVTFQESQLFGNLKVGDYKLVIRFTSGPDYKDIVSVRHPSVTANIVNATCSQMSANGSIQLTLNNAMSATFLWSNGSAEQNVSNLVAGKYKVTFVTDQNCTVKDSFVVASTDPSIVVTEGDTSVCPGRSVELKARGLFIDPNEMVSFSWLQGDTTLIGSSSSVFVSPDSASTYTVYMNYRSCVSKDTVRVKVHPLLGLYAGRDTTVAEGYSLQLDAIDKAGVGFVRYNWFPGLYLDNDTIKTPLLTPEEAKQEIIPYVVFATTKEGCLEIDSVYISIAGKIHPYSGFTPNGDEVNDYWVIDNAEAYPDLKVTVFNRWGEKVFQSKGYGGDKVFNGKRNGKDLPAGTYYYVIESGDGSNRKSGPLTIMR